MSQIWVPINNSTPLPPDIPTEFVVDEGGPVVPTDNTIEIIGRDNIDNNDNGIQTANNPGAPDNDPANRIAVELTNRTTRFLTTVNDTPTTIFDEDFGVDPAVFNVYGNVLAYDTIGDKSSTFDYSASYRVIDATTAIELGVEYSNIFEDPEMVNTDITLSVTDNNLVIQVIGLPAVSSVKWSLLFEYRQLDKD